MIAEFISSLLVVQEKEDKKKPLLGRSMVRPFLGKTTANKDLNYVYRVKNWVKRIGWYAGR